MKRLSLILMLALVSFVNGQITLTLDDVTGETGTEVTVPLDVTNLNNIGAISLKINFNQAVLSYERVENSPVDLTNAANNGVLTLAWFDITGSSPLNFGNGTFVNIVFSYNGGTSTLEFNEPLCEIANAVGQPQPVTYTDGSVSGGTPPAVTPPTLMSPSNGASNISLTPAFDWSTVANATSYQIQIASDAGFNTIIVDEAGIASSNYSTGISLTGNTEYFWRVRATDGNETSAWSSVFSFTTLQAGSNDVVFSLQTITGVPNSQVTVPMNVANLNNVGAISLKILYDTSKLTFVSLDNTDLQFTVNQVQDGLILAWFDFTGSSPLNFGSGKLLDIIFDYTTGDITLTFDENICEITEPNNTEIVVTYVNGSILEGEPLPDPPVLTAPIDGATNTATILTLMWQSVTSALSYSLQIGEDEQFTSTILHEVNITATEFEVPDGILNYGTTYYWRVNTTSAAGTGNFSLPFSFTTILEPLNTPVLSSPDNGANNQPLELNFDWNDVTDATHYIFVIAEDDAFTNITIQVESVLNSEYVTQSGTLDYSKTYYWRVMATDGTRFSEWSETRSFTTLSGVLDTPILNTPSNGAVDQPLELNFDWDDVTDATNYILVIAEDDTFTNLTIQLESLTNSEYTTSVGTLDYSTTYYWRVMATAGTRLSEWSSVRSFTTAAEALGIPTLIAPGNGSTGLSVTPSLDWSNVFNATSYSLQVASDDGFQNLAVDASNLTESNYSILSGILNVNTMYYWRVKANNNNGSSDWSDVWTFTTLSTNVEVYQSGIPDDFELNQNYPNPFNPTTKVRYSLPEHSTVSISVYNMIGQFVGYLVNENQSAGYYEVNFDATGLTSGTYIYKIEAVGESGKDFTQIKKMLLIK